MSDKFRIGVFSSGNGSNFEAIVKADIPNVEVSFLLCNIEDAYVLERAKNFSIDSILLPHKNFESRKDFEKEIISRIQDYDVDLIILAGFKRILSPFFINYFEKKIINLHPSLLPSFPGLRAPKQALEYGVKFTGCTVHFVDDGVDTGPIILQGLIEILDSDDEESLMKKIHEKEHEILPVAIELISEGKVKTTEGRRVFIDN
ncbi:MAG TPA: phosphoribosylglycinamide formyltransferase [Candidatus Dadabacteria bacterium]|nr:phosphoribosylglycinamide formyltransferase [Candidatus Dadabacteria bacterium]